MPRIRYIHHTEDRDISRVLRVLQMMLSFEPTHRRASFSYTDLLTPHPPDSSIERRRQQRYHLVSGS